MAARIATDHQGNATRDQLATNPTDGKHHPELLHFIGPDSQWTDATELHRKSGVSQSHLRFHTWFTTSGPVGDTVHPPQKPLVTNTDDGQGFYVSGSMNLQDFQTFLDTIAMRRPAYWPFQKLRILNSIAIHQQTGALPSEARMVNSLIMHPHTFNRLLIELINDGLVETIPCAWDGHRFLLVLTEKGTNRVNRLVDQFQAPVGSRKREPELITF